MSWGWRLTTCHGQVEDRKGSTAQGTDLLSWRKALSVDCGSAV